MRTKRNGQSFIRSVNALPQEMREFVKPTRVAHVWTRATFLADKDEYEDTVRFIKENHKAVAIFHKARRTVAK